MSTSSVNSLSSLTDTIATTNSSTNSSTGMGQGIDVQQFVKFAVAAQQNTITDLQTQQSTLASQISELSTIEQQVAALDDAAFALRDPMGAMSKQTASSSNSSMVQATASSTATAGAHSITVTNLATTSSYYTDEVASSSTALATGDTIGITVGGNSVANITIDSTNNTLATLAQAINNATTTVHAGVVTDANGARLSIVSATSGQPGDIAITGSLHLTDSGSTAVNFNQAVAGKNAQLTVDGMPVTSTSNTVNGAIAGVTLSLYAPTGSTPVSLNISPDTTSATTAINTFVNAYNTVVKEINAQFNVTSTSSGGPLETDNSVRQVQSMLLNAVSYSITGNNGMVNLASMGVNMNDDGTLTVDDSALSAALASNYADVQNFLQGAGSGFAQQMGTALQTVNAPSNGILAIDSHSISNNSQDIAQHISDLQAQLAVQEQTLTAVYSQVNTTLQQLPLLLNQISQQLSGLKSS